MKLYFIQEQIENEYIHIKEKLSAVLEKDDNKYHLHRKLNDKQAQERISFAFDSGRDEINFQKILTNIKGHKILISGFMIYIDDLVSKIAFEIKINMIGESFLQIFDHKKQQQLEDFKFLDSEIIKVWLSVILAIRLNNRQCSFAFQTFLSIENNRIILNGRINNFVMKNEHLLKIQYFRRLNVETIKRLEFQLITEGNSSNL